MRTNIRTRVSSIHRGEGVLHYWAFRSINGWCAGASCG